MKWCQNDDKNFNLFVRWYTVCVVHKTYCILLGSRDVERRVFIFVKYIPCTSHILLSFNTNGLTKDLFFLKNILNWRNKLDWNKLYLFLTYCIKKCIPVENMLWKRTTLKIQQEETFLTAVILAIVCNCYVNESWLLRDYYETISWW